MENEEILINEDVEPTPEPVIPYIYNFKPDTKEFTGVIEIAEKDIAKSNQVGYFVPLVHADATTVQPPEVEENQIQVYSKEVIEHKETDPETEEEIITYEVIESWNIEADYRKNFYKVDENLTVYDINTIGEQTGYIVVDKATGDDIKANKDWYKIVDDEVVKKSEEEYEQDEAEKEKERIGNLQITKRVFMLGLQQLGITYTQLKTLIATNEQAQMEWDLCVELQRKNPLLDIMAAQLEVSSAMLDYIFRKANGEDVQPPEEA